MSKMSNLFDDDVDEGEARAAAVGVAAEGNAAGTQDYRKLWAAEREKRLDLEIAVFELKGEVRLLREALNAATTAAAAAAAEKPAAEELKLEEEIETSTATNTEPVQEQTVFIAASTPAPARKQRDIFEESDDDSVGEGGKVVVSAAGAPSTTITTTPALAAAAQPEAPLSEWERLALEEKERRKLKARQRQVQSHAGPVAGRAKTRRSVLANSMNGLIAPTITATPTASTSVASGNVVNASLGDALPQQPHLPSPIIATPAAPPTPSNTHARSSSTRPSLFSSDEEDGDDASSDDDDDDDDDSNSGWDDDEDEGEGEGAVEGRLSQRGAATARAGTSVSANANASASASGTTIAYANGGDEMEAAVEASVLSWARGRDLPSLLSSVSSVFHGPLPDLSALGSLAAAQPSEVRKVYLKVVRCCHPDKQTADAEPRVRIEAQKIFSALADSYTAYRAAHGMQ